MAEKVPKMESTLFLHEREIVGPSSRDEMLYGASMKLKDIRNSSLGQGFRIPFFEEFPLSLHLLESCTVSEQGGIEYHCGRGDKRSKKGKVFRHTYGNSRLTRKNKIRLDQEKLQEKVKQANNLASHK